MAEFRVVGRIGQTLGPMATGVDHLEVIETSGGPTVVSLSGHGGGLVTLSFGAWGQAIVSDTQVLPDGVTAFANRTFSTISTQNGDFVAVSNPNDNQLLTYQITGSSIGPSVMFGGTGISAPDGAIYEVSGNGYLFAAGADSTLRAFQPAGGGGGGNFNAGQVTRDNGSTFLADPAAIESLSVGAADFVITASDSDTGVSVFRVDPGTGNVTQTGAMGAELGLGLFARVADMETVAIDGTGYVLVLTRPESGTGAALSVISVDGNGRVGVADHVLDNQLSRFGSATELEVVQNGDWTYVLAAGGDDGITLFALSPGGRLVHLDTIESTVPLMLDSISGMAAAIAQDGDLQIILAQQTVQAFTQLEVDLSDQGVVRSGAGSLSGTGRDDMLVGSGGADTLTGGGGDDILEDGAGRDVLRGDGGADTFILNADGQRDVIEGFVWDQDRIDLTDVPFLYSFAQISFVSRSWGGEITYRGETLELRTANGAALTEAQVAEALDWAIDRPILLVEEPGAILTGTGGNDTLTGGSGRDTLEGLAGDDLLEGEGGDDRISGGSGADTIFARQGDDSVEGNAGQDLVYLGNGNDRFDDSPEANSAGSDTVFGGAGDDILISLAGGDELHGEDGNDELRGGTGADRLFGGINFDTIAAGDGNDTAWGGDGRDLIFLGQGNDVFNDNGQGGELGRDTVFAGAGDDRIEGGNGADEFHGEDGNDIINGRLGSDSLYGGLGSDTISADNGDDRVWGGNGRDLVFLGLGNDVFNDNEQGGEAGQDTVFGGFGNDTIRGGGGNDELHGKEDSDVIFGGLDDDLVFGGAGADTLYAGAGNDEVWGGDGTDLAFLGLGNDRFNDNGQGGEFGSDTVFAGAGDDTIEGGNGADEFHGEDGNDVINARLGNDSVFGGIGSDTIRAGDGDDQVWGGDGRDLVFLGNGNDVFNDNGQGGEAGQDTVFTGLGDDTVEGGNGADVFYGEGGNDRIFGRLGNDTIFGGDNFDFIDAGDGNDLVFGGNGQDRVILGAGNDRFVDTDQGGDLGRDTITGGAGADTFVFGRVISDEVVTDHQLGVDTLELSSALVGGRSAGRVAADAQVIGGGVMINLGPGQSIFLDGLTTTAFLSGDIEIV